MRRLTNALISTAASFILSGVSLGSAATIGFSGSVNLSGLSEVVFTTPALQQARTFLNFNSSSSVATSINGFSSLAGVNLADLGANSGDLESVSRTYSPSGCTPVAGNPAANCATVMNNWGETDGNPNFFNITLAGSGTILSGVYQSLVSTIITDTASPNFGTGSTTGVIQIVSGQAPYYSEVLALTGGTGLVTLTSSPTTSCGAANPCNQGTVSTLTFVPEPTTIMLMGLGLVGLAAIKR